MQFQNLIQAVTVMLKNQHSCFNLASPNSYAGWMLGHCRKKTATAASRDQCTHQILCGNGITLLTAANNHLSKSAARATHRGYYLDPPINNHAITPSNASRLQVPGIL